MKFDMLLEKTLIESILEIHSPESERPTINDLIVQFYELTYKIAEIRYSKKVKPGVINKRRDMIIEKLEKMLWPVITEMKRRFVPVFKGWLGSHAITDPHQWAVARVSEDSDYKNMGEINFETLSASIVDEYNRYKSPKAYLDVYNRKNLPKLAQIIAKEIMPRINEFPAFQKAFQHSFNLQKQEAENMLEQYQEGDTDIDLGGIGYFDTYEEAKTTLESYTLADFIYMLEDMGAFSDNEQLATMLDLDDIYDMAVELYEKLVFPIWYGNWKSKGIDQTRANVENVYNERLLKTTSNLSTEIENIGTIIQTAHQNGNLIKDYMGQLGEGDDDANEEDIGYKLLDQLTDGTYSGYKQWNADIKEAGF